MNDRRSAETLILSFKNLGQHGVRTPESSTNFKIRIAVAVLAILMQ